MIYNGHMFFPHEDMKEPETIFADIHRLILLEVDKPYTLVALWTERDAVSDGIDTGIRFCFTVKI